MYVCSTVGFFRSFVFIQGVLLFSCFDFAFFFFVSLFVLRSFFYFSSCVEISFLLSC